MSKTYKYSGLTPELHSRLVSEHAALREKYKGSEYRQHFRAVKQCSEKRAIIIYQALNNAVMERARISPQTVDRLEGIISDELYHDLKEYLVNHYTRGKPTQQTLEKTNAGLPEHLFKRFREEVEALRKEHARYINDYIRSVKGCSTRQALKTQNAISVCYSENATLTPLKAIQMEGVLSRELFSEIADYVFNRYEWSERLDDEIDRIILKYRTRGELGRKKRSVKRALYTALAMGL